MKVLDYCDNCMDIPASNPNLKALFFPKGRSRNMTLNVFVDLAILAACGNSIQVYIGETRRFNFCRNWVKKIKQPLRIARVMKKDPNINGAFSEYSPTV